MFASNVSQHICFEWWEVPDCLLRLLFPHFLIFRSTYKGFYSIISLHFAYRRPAHVLSLPFEIIYCLNIISKNFLPIERAKFL